MGNQGLKYAAVGAVVLAVILGVLAYRMTLTATQAAREQAKVDLQAERQGETAVATTLAVIALNPLAATRPITEDDVALMPVAVVPEHYFTRVEDVVGRAPLIDVDVGAPVTPRYFRDSNVLARIIPEGHKAMSLEISDVVAVGGFVRPGDEVDLLLFVRVGDTPAQSRILQRRVLVLAYEDRIIERPQGLTKEEGRPERRSRVRTAVVAIPEQDTTRVMLGASLGDIRLALHRQVLNGQDEPGDADSPLPKATPPPEVAKQQAPGEKDQTITLQELTRIAAKKPDKPKPPPYVIEVFKGSATEKVRD